MSENCFIRATRNDATHGLGSAIQRCELYEMIIRLCRQWVMTVWTVKEPVSDHLHEFINIYLVPFYSNSPIVNERMVIRESKHLNQLLYDNELNLEILMGLLKNNR